MRLTWDRVKRKRQLEETKENNAPSDYTFSNPIIISDMIVNKDSNVNAGSNTAGGDQVNTNTYTSGHIPEDNNNNIPELNANSDIIDNGHQTQSRKRKHEEDTVQAALIEAVNLEAATEIVEIENEKNNPQTVEGSEFIVNIDNTNAADNLSETREESIKSDVNAVDCAKEKEVSGIPEIVEKSESLKVLRSANSESVVFDNMYEANTKAIQINLDVPKETTAKENIRPSKDAETQTDEGSVAPKQVVNEKAIQTELCKVDEKGVQVDKDIVIEKIETGAYNEMEIDDFVESSKTIAEPATYTSQNSNSNIPNFNANFNSNCMFNANKVSENSATIAAAPKPQVSFAFETVSVNTQIPPINTPFTFGSDNKIASINAPKVQTPFTFGSNNKITPVNTPKTPAAFTFGSDNKIGSIQAPFVFGSGSKVAPINTPKVQTPFTFGSDKIAPINAPKTQATFTFDSGNKFFGNNVPTAQAQFTIGSDNTPKAQSQFTIGSGNKYDQFQNSRRVIKAKRRR